VGEGRKTRETDLGSPNLAGPGWLGAAPKSAWSTRRTPTRSFPPGALAGACCLQFGALCNYHAAAHCGHCRSRAQFSPASGPGATLQRCRCKAAGSAGRQWRSSGAAKCQRRVQWPLPRADALGQLLDRCLQRICPLSQGSVRPSFSTTYDREFMLGKSWNLTKLGLARVPSCPFFAC
jgi:hypothetical protein